MERSEYQKALETIKTMINIFCRGILKEGQDGNA
jgi:hypothetical protein